MAFVIWYVQSPKGQQPLSGPVAQLHALLDQQLDTLQEEVRSVEAWKGELERAKGRLDQWSYDAKASELAELAKRLTPMASGTGQVDSADSSKGIVLREAAARWDDASRGLLGLMPASPRHQPATGPEDEYARSYQALLREPPAVSTCRGFTGVYSTDADPNRALTSIPTGVEGTRKMAEACLRVVSSMVEVLQSQRNAAVAAIQNELDRTARKLTSLQKDVTEKDEQLNSTMAGLRRDSSLDTLIKGGLPAIALFLLFLFVVARTFPEAVQHRIVDGRLLLDLSTVVLLVAAILVLGLAERLSAEVLGTLIGGISGYVLSRSRFDNSEDQAQPGGSLPPPP